MPLRGTQDSYVQDPLSSGQGAVQQQHPEPLSSGQGATHCNQDRNSLSSGQGMREYTEQGSSSQGTGFAHGLPMAASTLSGPKASKQAVTLSSGQVNSCPTYLEAMVKDTISRLLPSINSEAVRATRAQASDPAPTGDPSPLGDSTPVGGLALAGDLVPAGNLAPQSSTAAVQQASLQATNQLTGDLSAQASKANSPALPLDLHLTKEIKAKIVGNIYVEVSQLLSRDL